jgi:O-methyltransferase
MAETPDKPLKLPLLGELRLDGAMNFGSPVYWGVDQPERFAGLLDEARKLVAPGFYLGDNLFTWCRNNSLFEDVTFRNALQSNIANEADQAIAWRRYILACAAYHCVQLGGDFVECGVYMGSGVKTVMDYLGGPEFPRRFWAYDAYDFNPVAGHEFDGQQAGLFEKVKERFKGYDQVNFIKGLLPASFAQGMPEKIAYLHIDLNNAAAEIAVLERLFERVITGGIVILDDYEWSGIYRPQKAAEDPWFAARNYRVFPLPTGQGLIIKR